MIFRGKTLCVVATFDFEGTDTVDATATAEDIAKGETAYIASGLVTGTMDSAEEASF